MTKVKNMETRKFYRDSLEETIVGRIKIRTTSDGHVVEAYRLSTGKWRYFATLAGSHWCAHGDTIAEAVADALWKDPKRRPTMQAVIDSIKKDGRSRKITLNEFRLLTGACRAGCYQALKNAGRDSTPMTADDIIKFISRDWGLKLLSILCWEEVKS